jgi:16S rRNA (adenine1518-N6/adenine1519-N6)-dimethyltransferase
MRAKKSLGQNFLSHPGVLRSMAKAARIEKDVRVVEIGPGKGSLTKILLESGAKVTAIEKDDRLIPILEKTFETDIREGRLTLIHDDILTLNPEILFPKEPYLLIANIPYYITGAIIRLFLEAELKPIRVVLMTQKEVADRIVARDKKESVLSLSVKLFGTPKIIQKVSRELFSPKPNVDSSILLIEDVHQSSLGKDGEKVFFELIKTAFNQKRKTIGASLKKILAEHPDVFEKANISSKDRPEDIEVEKWKELKKHLFLHEEQYRQLAQVRIPAEHQQDMSPC